MPHLKGSRGCLAVAFSVLLLGACSQNQPAATTSTSTATSTAASGPTAATPSATNTSTTAASTGAVPATATSTAAPSTATTTSSTVAPGPLTSGIPVAVPGNALAPAAVLPPVNPLSAEKSATTPAATPLLAAKPAAPASVPAGAPAGNDGQVRMTLSQFPESLAICNVAGNEITVRDYKRMLKLQQMQMNQSLAGDPAARERMMEVAKKNNVTLSPEEKAQLIEAAKRQKGTEKEFQEWLKSINGTEEQFKAEIWKTGLAFKTSNMILEQGLLPELVNRELMAQASTEIGGEKQAMDMYFRFKVSKHFNVLKELTQLSNEDIREEIVKAELAKQQLLRIQKRVKVTDQDLKKVYEANKKNLKHGDQIRLAKLLILCPPNDVGETKSIRTQLANSTKLSGEELDKKVAEFQQQKKNEATLLLARAIAGEDFTKMANDLSQDSDNERLKNGGDLGWLETKSLVTELRNAVAPLKKGQCIPSVVSNPMGYLIFKVTDRRPEGYSPLADIRPQLEERIKAELLNQAVQGWLNKRKSIVRVEFTPNFLALANKAKSPPATTGVH